MKTIRIPYFTCRFTLEGLNLERFINMLGKEDIPLLAIRREGNRRLHCECYEADMPAIEALVAEKGWRLTGRTPLQLSAFVAFLRRRWGIPLGLLLMLAVILTLYQFVWRVDIKGAGPYAGDVSIFLAEEGLGLGTPKARINAEELTRKLNHRYPAVAWFSLYVHDVTLMVDCTLGVPAPDMEPVNPGDLVAARDGIVEQIRVYAGTAAVKTGDIVRKGQVLIRGQERIADEAQRDVAAQGVVMARCWTRVQVALPIREVKSQATGRAASHQQLCTPLFSYPAELEKPDYLAYDTTISLVPVVGSFFPCWVQKTEFLEVEMEYTARNTEDVKKEAAKAALEKLTDALRAHQIIDKWVDYCMIEGDLLAATATAEWTADIGSRPPE